MRGESSGEEGLLAEVIEGKATSRRSPLEGRESAKEIDKDTNDEREALEGVRWSKNSSRAEAKVEAQAQELIQQDRREVSQASRGRDQDAGGG